MKEIDENKQLHEKIDNLTRLVEQLSIEIAKLRDSERECDDQQEFRNQEFLPGDKIRISNNHKGTEGQTTIVTRVYKDKVYFKLKGKHTFISKGYSEEFHKRWV